jgi:hypothetical protein
MDFSLANTSGLIDSYMETRTKKIKKKAQIDGSSQLPAGSRLT